MKIFLEIEGLLRLTGELEMLNAVKPEEPKTEEPAGDVIEWTGDNTVLEGGKRYYCPEYKMIPIKNKTVRISKTGEENASIVFGRAGYSQWDSTGPEQPRFLFDVFENADILIDGVDLFSSAGVDEVQPFFMTVFRANAAENQMLVLQNLDTNMGRALAYSAKQEITQTIVADGVGFAGIMWEELKANGGGGLLGFMRNCHLRQIKPRTHFEADLLFIDRGTVMSTEDFARIDSQFNSAGNSCNILFVEGMTFYLPSTGEIGEFHTIRPIPYPGDTIALVQGPEFLQTRNYSLQAGDVLEIAGKPYQILSKDRPRDGFESSGYSIDLNIGAKITSAGSSFTAKVIKSRGAELIGKNFPGYMIFKYNKHFHTNAAGTFKTEDILASVPFGVLSYNHEEVSFDYENVTHEGFYRQSRSGVGKSNKYRFVKCKGYADQFNPPIPIITE